VDAQALCEPVGHLLGVDRPQGQLARLHEGTPHVVRIVRDVGLSHETVEVLVDEVHECVAATIGVLERGDDEVLLLIGVDGRECLIMNAPSPAAKW